MTVSKKKKKKKRAAIDSYWAGHIRNFIPDL